MNRLISFAAAPLLAIAVFSASANADPIKDRQAIMKDQGKTVGSITPIIKGEKPFDAAAVIAALKHLNEDAQKIDPATLFPAGSDKGGETTASPKIWEDNAGFIGRIGQVQEGRGRGSCGRAERSRELQGGLQPGDGELRRLSQGLPHQESSDL